MIWLILILSLGKGDKVPPFTGTTVNGEEFVLDSLKGTPVVILDFWALFCKPCIKQMEKMKGMPEKYKGKLVYIAINEDGPMSQRRVKSFVKTKKFDFTILIDPDRSIGNEYNVSSLPTTIILDDSLRVRDIHIGFKPGDEKWLEEKIKEYLGVPEEDKE
ncbi:MAG TPA: TlpA family protein disulfide reductase [candidate division WOR-3 bacterium]|uniref:TlpA family protein disulfide reductase n=1 Tax=candidate division WOR-3 bacterium TaxID=2052148 RepID=A0A7C0VAN6_UNCW3|nr:TlpA family protein disulfide reductase [candidate division WOR-3 bacterium]